MLQTPLRLHSVRQTLHPSKQASTECAMHGCSASPGTRRGASSARCAVPVVSQYLLLTVAFPVAGAAYFAAPKTTLFHTFGYAYGECPRVWATCRATRPTGGRGSVPGQPARQAPRAARRRRQVPRTATMLHARVVCCRRLHGHMQAQLNFDVLNEPKKKT